MSCCYSVSLLNCALIFKLLHHVRNVYSTYLVDTFLIIYKQTALSQAEFRFIFWVKHNFPNRALNLRPRRLRSQFVDAQLLLLLLLYSNMLHIFVSYNKHTHNKVINQYHLNKQKIPISGFESTQP